MDGNVESNYSKWTSNLTPFSHDLKVVSDKSQYLHLFMLSYL